MREGCRSFDGGEKGMSEWVVGQLGERWDK